MLLQLSSFPPLALLHPSCPGFPQLIPTSLSLSTGPEQWLIPSSSFNHSPPSPSPLTTSSLSHASVPLILFWSLVYFLEYILRIPKNQFKRTCAPLCSQQHYLQQPRSGNSPSAISRWVAKKPAVHLHNGILCSSKKEGILTFCNSRMELGFIILNEISQSMKDKHHMISLISGI